MCVLAGPRVELGRTLWRLGDKRSALAELESAMDLDVEDINAHLQKARCFLHVTSACSSNS